ncbi:MAG: autotransporter-associated beta strand repeat-containing protein, partial [Cyclobacteriaceae bacterium]
MSLILRPYKFFSSVLAVNRNIYTFISAQERFLSKRSGFLLVAFLFVSLLAQAQKTWLPATGGNWATGANWSGGVAPIAGDAVIINSDQSANITNIPSISLSSLTVSGTCALAAAASGNMITVTSSFSVSSGETLTMGVGGGRLDFTLASTATGIISGTASLNAGAGVRTFLVAGDLSIPSGGLLTGTGSSNFTLNSGATLRIGSTGGIAATGGASGSVQVTGTRTYSTGANYHFIGVANQSEGTGVPATVASLTINNTGGGGNNTVSLVSNIAITNTLTVSNGVFALGANNVTSVGSVNMTGTSIAGTGTLTLAGDVTTNASGSTAGIGAPIVLSGANRTLIIGDGGATPDLQISSGISGGFGFIKSGSGLLNLFGVSTYTGATIVSAGTLRLGSSTALGTTASGTVVNNSATIDISGLNYASAEPLTLNGSGISGGGALFNSSATGATFGGLITLGSSATISGSTGTINISNAGTITGSGFDLTLDGAAGGTLASSLGTGTGGIIKIGAGTWILSGSNTFTGNVLINTGTLRLSGAGALNASNSLVFGSGSSGVLQLNGNTYSVAGLNTNATVGSPIIENIAAGSAQLTVLSAGANIFAGVITNGGAGSLAIGKAGSGSLTLSGNNTYTGATTLVAGTLNINSATAIGAGNFIINGGTIDNTSAGPITLSNNNPQTWSGDFSFNGTQNLNLGTGNVTIGANRQVTVNANTLTVGGVISAAAFNLTKAGAGILSFGSSAVTLNSLVINAGTLTSTSGTLTLAGSLTNSGTFNNNGGTVHYNGGAPQTVAAVTYNNLTLSGAGQKNGGGAIIVSGNLTNSSIFDLGANTLSVTGTIDNTGGNIRFTGPTNGIASNTGIITYYGASQTIATGTYNNLVINQSAGVASLGGSVTINGVLTLTNGNLNLNGFDLTLGPTATISVASPSETRMIIATGGNQVIKTFSGIGSFVFPIGDNTGTSEYSPITVNITAGSGFPSNIGVSVVDAKHPNNSSATNFLTRYWEITQPGITGCVATITGTYTAADVTGTEGSINAANLPGAFNQATNPWIKFSGLGGNTLTATAAALSLGQTNTFTGITGADPTATIVGGGVSICNGSSVNLTTNVTGDPTFTYSWSPAAGLSATNISNPIATPTGTTVYTVTIRDGNGIVDTDNTTITINPATPTPTIGTSGSIVCDAVSPDVTLTSSAAPNGGSYIWYKDGIATGDVGSSLIINDPAGSGLYTVAVIDGISLCVSAQSVGETVTINALPLTTPVVTPATTTICSGTTVTVNVAGSQAGINYELFDGVTSLSSAVAGTGGSINLITSVLTSNTTITVRATNPTTSCTTLLSGTSVVTVNPIPATPTIGPVGPVVVCEGTAAIVLTSSAGAGNQWYKDGSPIGGATATTLNITTAPANSGSYTVISTVSGCASLVSTAVGVTINALPLTTPVVTPATTTICSGTTVTVNVAGSQAGINYELFDGVTSLSSAVAGTGGSINLITSVLTSNTTITVRATNPTTSCTTLLSGTSVVTVNPIPATPTIGPVGPVVVCEGTAAIVLTSSAGAGNQWYKDGSPIGGATATTLNITTAPANSGSYTVISTVSGCASLVSTAVAVTINALPLTTPVVTPATTTICSGTTVTVNVAGSQAGINYELFDGVTSLSSAVAGTGGSINLITSVLTSNTTITVRATNPTTSCTTLLSGTSVVTVNP